MIDRYYDPAGLGIDNGGNGVSIVQELTSLDKYRPLGLKSRLRGFDFGSSISVYQEENGRDVKKPTKEFMTSLIKKSLQKRELVFPVTDLEIESQFTTQTYSLNTGKIQYSKGNDHIIDAIRCLMLVRNRLQEEDPLGSSNIEFVMPLMTDPIFDF